MPLFVFDIGEKDRAVSRFIGHVRSELQKAFVAEKSRRKLTQQDIATSIGVHRSAINRQLMGYDNLTLRSVAELAWAIGYKPDFTLSKQEATKGTNYFITTDHTPQQNIVNSTVTQTSGTNDYRVII